MSGDAEAEHTNLPPELILHIIDYLDTDSDEDRTALARCALSSTMFRYDAQKRLFCSITVPYTLMYINRDPLATTVGNVGTVDTRKSQQLFQAMSISPNLATFVRRLHISLDCQYFQYDRVQHRDTMSIPIKQSSLPAFFSMMNNLDEFRWYNSSITFFGRLTTETQASISSLVQANRHLRKINMVNTIKIPPSLLFSSPKLQTLAIGQLQDEFVPTENSNIDSDSVQPPQPEFNQLTTLVSFNLGHTALQTLLRFLQHPKCPIDYSKLKYFDVESRVRESHSEIQTILNMCKKTLTQFNWNTRMEEVLLPDDGPVVDLSNLLKLSELRLTGCISARWHYDDGHYTHTDILKTFPLTYFSNLLSTLPRSILTNGLLRVRIILYLSDISVDTAHTIRWDALVDALLDPARKFGDVSVLMKFDDGYVPLTDPSMAERRLAVLKENVRLKELGESLVFR